MIILSTDEQLYVVLYSINILHTWQLFDGFSGVEKKCLWNPGLIADFIIGQKQIG